MRKSHSRRRVIVAAVLSTALVAAVVPAAAEDTAPAIEGTVTSSEDGPAPGVCVAVFYEDDPVVIAVTGDDGTYRLEPAPEGTFDVQAYDCLNEPAAWNPSTTVEVTVGVGQTVTGVDFTVSSTGVEPGTPGPGDPGPVDPSPEPDPDPGPGDAEPPSFTDTAGSVFAEDIVWLATAGITRGCNPPANDRFCPDDPVTRGQMAAFLVRALGLPAGDVAFTDTASSVFAGDVSALAAAGITLGCNPPDNTLFCPDDFVTRGQMAAFLSRALGLTYGTSTFEDTAGHIFEGDIARLADVGITKGCNPPANTRFCPDEPVTRGQMAAFLHRALPPLISTQAVSAASPLPPDLQPAADIVIIPPVVNPAYISRFKAVTDCSINWINNTMLMFSATPDYVFVPHQRSTAYGDDTGWEMILLRLFRWNGAGWVAAGSTGYHTAQAFDTGNLARVWWKWTGSGWARQGTGGVGWDWSNSVQASGYYAVAAEYYFNINGGGWRQGAYVWLDATGSASDRYYCYKP